MNLSVIKETVLNFAKSILFGKKISILKALNFLHKKDKLTLCEKQHNYMTNYAKGGKIMKLSKALASLSVVAMSAVVLAACGNRNSAKDSSSKEAKSSAVKESSNKKATAKKQVAGGELKDGTYHLEEKNYENNYRVKMSMTVAGSKVTKTTYDYVDKDGKSKQDDKAYNEKMKKVSKTNPQEYIPQLNKEFTANGADVSSIEVVSGATHSSNSFKNYAQQLVQAAQAGNTETIEINNGAKLQDGTYKLEEKNYSHDYRTVFTMVVKDGKITDSKFDNINKDGKSKADDAAYNKQMKKIAKTNPKEYIAKLNSEFVKAQEPGKVDVVSGATESSHSFVNYAEQLVNAAQKGNTATITVDNIVYAE